MEKKSKVEREHILDAALSLMRQEGFEKLTARNIAEYLNASTQPIYKEFENMSDLKDNLFKHIKDSLGNSIFKLDQTDTDLQTVCTNYINFANNEGTLFAALYRGEDVKVTAVHDYINESLHEVIKRTEGFEETTRADREVLFDIVWPAVHGLAILISQDRYSFTEEAIQERVASIVTHSIRVWEQE